MNASSAPVLRVSGLTVVQPGGVTTLRGVDLELRAGECLAVVGRSGSGKTTLLRALLGLLPRAARVSGSVLIEGTEVVGAPERVLQSLRGGTVGYVGQDPHASFDPLRTVGHHVAEAWRARGVRPPVGAVTERVAELGVAVAAARLRQRPHQWSGGMLQRASIAGAGVHRPALTLADEPTSALDAELAEGVLAALRRAATALLLVSHDLRLVGEVADRIAVLDAGRVVEHGPPAAILRHPAHPVTAALTAAIPAPHRPGAAVRAPREGAEIVSAMGLLRQYPGVVAVDGVTLRVRGGEVLGICGPSGSGKSTLLRLLAGLERPDEGELRYAGTPVWQGGRRVVPRTGWVMPVFQDPRTGLDARWPVWRSLVEPLGIRRRNQGIPVAEERLAAAGLAAVSPLARPGTLSSGQCQRISVLRALIAGPALVVADEPASALDTVAAATVMRLLRQAADAGAAVVVVSHDEPRLAEIADRITRMPLPPNRPSPATASLKSHTQVRRGR